MKLILLRHGESLWNRENKFTGWTDVPLTEHGKDEARYAGKLLKESGEKIDICYTSYLKRAVQTLNVVLEEMDIEWLPVYKDWRLNERHYGALQGLNKRETAEKYGEDQVKLWRRSFAVKPPILSKSDERNPARLLQYQGIPSIKLPLSESLKDTSKRVNECFEENICPQLQNKKDILLVAHGNSIRALIMRLEKLTPQQIIEVNLPTAVPLVYELDSQLQIIQKNFLGDPKWIKDKTNQVVSQGTRRGAVQ